MKHLLSRPGRTRPRWLGSVFAAGAAHAIPVLWVAGPTSSPSFQAELARAIEIPIELKISLPRNSPTTADAQPTAALPKPAPSHAAAAKLRVRSDDTRAVRDAISTRIFGAAERFAAGEHEPEADESDTTRVAREPAASERALARVVANRPRLLADANPCRGMFPERTKRDHGTVTVALHVTEAGTALQPRVLSELPAGEGFARAAERCSERLRFRPGHDATGQPVASNSVVRLRFAR